MHMTATGWPTAWRASAQACAWLVLPRGMCEDESCQGGEGWRGGGCLPSQDCGMLLPGGRGCMAAQRQASGWVAQSALRCAAQPSGQPATVPTASHRITAHSGCSLSLGTRRCPPGHSKACWHGPWLLQAFQQACVITTCQQVGCPGTAAADCPGECSVGGACTREHGAPKTRSGPPSPQHSPQLPFALRRL
jgi:hypothetical protein